MFFLLYFAFLFEVCFSCTNFLFTPGSTEDGSSFISYAADSHTLFGCLYFRPAGDYPSNSTLAIYDWDSGKYLGDIDQVSHTYNVVANTNEYQVSIGETTYGGLAELGAQTAAKLDYGNLMWVTLQRVTTAREAVLMMGTLVAKYGYYSEGESFSISDPNEVWHMEMIGKGNYELGAVWVAKKIPDGYIGGHANQARITTFPLDDPETCLYSKDVISFAKQHGFYPKEGAEKDFSFSDVYDPLNFEGARFCEARVWSMFNKFSDDMGNYLDYAQGYNLTNRMPLFIKPNKKVALADVMEAMRDHYEGTWFDMTQDWGAEPFQLPYRWRPLTWTHEKKTYLNERAVGTQQTAQSFIAQARSWLPREIGALTWWGPDDTYSTVYAPFYASMNAVPDSYQCSKGSIMEFSYDSIFWLFNMVAHFAYYRYDTIYPDIKAKMEELEASFIKQIPQIDEEAQELYKQSKDQAIEFLTSFSSTSGNNVFEQWTKLFATIFPKYFDGDVRKSVSYQKYPVVTDPGYPEEWYSQIVSTSGNHFIDLNEGESNGKPKTLSKLRFL